MRFSVSVRPLRHAGARLSPDRLEPFSTGLLVSTREGAALRVAFVSHVGGPPLLRPLYDPRLIRADETSWVLQGIELNDGAAHVQEWELRQIP